MKEVCKTYISWLLLCSVFLLFGCVGDADGSDETIKPSSQKEIKEFSLKVQDTDTKVEGIIKDNKISVIMPYNTAITNLVATFKTTGKSVKVGDKAQISGETSNDFTNPVDYLVTAGDGTTNTYSVTVADKPSSNKEIKEFSLTVQDTDTKVEGIIKDNKISVIMPYNTAITNLVATFKTTGKSVKVGDKAQISGETSNDFTNPVDYLVTAEDGTTNTYRVKVEKKPLFSCVKDEVTDNPCGCLIQNDGTSNLMWYADGSQEGTLDNWTDNSLKDFNWTGNSLKDFNSKNHCGYSDWKLPSSPDASYVTHFVDQVGGEWGSLGKLAKNNGWQRGHSLANWLNNVATNHFSGVKDISYGSTTTIFKDPMSWVVQMGIGIFTDQYNNVTTGILLVRSHS